MTDHSADIDKLRRRAETLLTPGIANEHRLAADLLEIHDRTGISLDNWESARTFVERRIGHSITENHV